MPEKTIPFTKARIDGLAREHPTPFHVYDEKTIRETARRLNRAFSWVERGGFKNYFAVKALPNPYIVDLLREEGMGADCSSLPELAIANAVGIKGEEIMFTSNDTPAEEFVAAREAGAVINLDDLEHIAFLEKAAGLPEVLCFRYNPGPLREGNQIIGNPVEAKYGMKKEQMLKAYEIAKGKGVKRFGIHTMIVSNMLDEAYLVETARMLFSLAAEIKTRTGVHLEFANLGGGIGVPYRPDQQAVDIEAFSEGVRQAYEEIIVPAGLAPLRVVMECGRAMTGPAGYLVSRVRHVTSKYREYVGLDACMANLMRPALYGAYHHITVLGKENAPLDHVYDVTGSLCENNDKFAVQRALPRVEPGDLAVIHDTGAHGHAMGFNYNGKLRSAEFLLGQDGSFKEIRRAETVADYFSTLDFQGSRFSGLGRRGP